MKKSILEISLSIFVLVLAVAPGVMAQQHFDWAETDANMSVLITGATIDDETIVTDDEIGIFTPGGLCAGGVVVPDNFPEERLGSAAFGAEQGQDNGFRVGEDISFRIWDREGDFEANAAIQVGNDVEPVYVTNGFIVLSLSAVSPGRHFFWRITDTNMSTLITGATIAGESLIEGDEIGAFTEDGLCGGGGIVPADFPENPMGIAIFGSEQGQDNGFQANEGIEFRLWDHLAEVELVANMDIIRGEAIYVTNGLLIVSLEADAPPEIVLSANEHDFGEVNIGESSDWAFTVSNDGENDLVVLSMEPVGGFISVDFDEEVTIEPEATFEFTLTFAPDAEGQLEGALRILSNDPDDDVVTILVTGIGILVLPPTIVLSTDEMQFGNVIVGAERSGAMTISNSGDELLVINAIAIEDEAFSSDFENQIEIVSGESAEVIFTFSPQESGDLVVDAVFQSNDPENGEVNLRLIGTGFALGEDHYYEFAETGINSTIHVNEALLDGESLVDNDEIGVFTTDGLCAGASLVEQFPFDIIAWGAEQDQDNGFQDGEAITFVYYDPAADQEFLAISEVVEGDMVWFADGASTVTLSALREPPDIFIASNEYRFGMVRLGDVGQWALSVENQEGSDLVISMVEIEGEYFEVDFQDEVVIESGRSHDFTVTFTPEAEGDFEGMLTIISNDPDEHVLEIALFVSCEEILPPTIVPSTDLLDFQRVFFGESLELALQINNEGDELLVIDAIDLEEGVFSFDFEGQIELAGGELAVLNVTFTPEEAIDYLVEMTIHSNDPENGESVVGLWGIGIDPDQKHYVWEQTDANLSILVLEALLNDESLVEHDEIGLFTEGGVCAGGGEVPANFPDEPMGVAAFGAEQGLDNGFVANEPIAFRVWDFSADVEVEADFEEVMGEAVYIANGFLVVNLDAQRQQGEPEPEIRLSDDNHDFGLVRPGDSDEWEFRVRNIGREILVVSDMGIEGEYYSVNFEGEIQLDFREEHIYTVVFAPEAEGEYAGLITIASNDPNFGVLEISLAGFSEEVPLPPAISIDPAAIDFDRIVVGEQLSLPVTISNDGEELLIVDACDVEGEMFSSNFENPIELAEGETADVLLTFAPTESGEHEGTAIFHSNDPENENIQVALAGRGFVPGEEPHYEWVGTDANMSILIVSATLDGESLVQFDEVGVFTPDDLCAGGGMVPQNFPNVGMGVAVFGAEQDMNNGFQAGEAVSFMVWDHMAEVEAPAEFNVRNGVEPVYQVNGFLVVELIAESRAMPRLDIDEDSYDFGVVPVGESAEWAVTIGNTGEADLVIDDIHTVGDYFSVNVDGQLVVEPESQIEVVVTFAPEEEGEFEGALSMATNDPNYDVLELRLNGRTFEPQEQQAIIVVEPDELNFGRVVVNEVSSLSLTISNEGDEILSIDAIDLDDEFFTTDFEDAFEIDPGANTEINVTFAPTEAIDYQAELVIHSNDPDNDALPVQLSGSGIIPGEDVHFEFDRTDANMSILVMEALLNGESLVETDEIGVFTPGGLCAGGVVIDANFPDGPAGIAAWGAEQGQNNGFAAGEEIAFRVWDFSAGFEAAAVFEVINEVEPIYQVNGFVVITMIAEGEPDPQPDIFLPEDNHDFGEVPVGEFGEWNMTIENHGDGDLIISGMEIVGEFFSVDFDEEVVIAAENGSEFTLTFAPEADGEFNGTLLITSNDPEDDLLEVSLAGRTVDQVDPPMISVDPEAIDFGDVEVGSDRVRAVTITNMGDEPLIVDAVDLEEGAFSIDFNDAVEIGGGDDLVITVTFVPAEVADYGADMTIHSNDQENDAVVVQLSGAGIEAGEEFIWDFMPTDANMSILVMEAILNGESLVEGDLVGAFTPAGLCAGFNEIPAGFPDQNLGLAAWGAEQGQNNGFAVGEEINIRVWDIDADIDVAAEYEIINGAEPIFAVNGFMVITISADGQVEQLPEIVVEDDVHDFGEVAIGEAAEWQLNVANAGNADLVIDAMAIDGDYFAVDFGDAVVIAPDEAAEFTVTFAPEAEGEFAATLTIQSNDGDVEVALSGHTPVQQDEPPMIMLDPEALEFGRVAVEDVRALELMISNAGDELLVIDAIDLEEGVFTIDFNDPIEIAGGDGFGLLVTFAPDVAEDFAADMTIHSNDPDNDAVVIPLAGTGFVPGEEPHFVFVVTDINMSVLIMEALLGGESLVPSDEIGLFTNNGTCAGGGVVPDNFPDAPMGTAAWGTEQGQDNGFAVGEDLNFRFWDFEAEIEINAEITQVDNGVEPIFAVNGFIVLRLGADVEQLPEIVVEEDVHDFGEVEIGAVAEWQMSVANAGDADLRIDAMIINDDYFAVDFDDVVVVAPGDAVEFTVIFAPEEEGEFATILTIITNDRDVEVALSGHTPIAQPDPPMIFVEPEAIDFGDVEVGSDRTLAVTITNIGEELLVVDAIDLEEGVFAVNFNNPIELESGDDVDLIVTFTPPDVADYAADMVIHSNDPDNDAVVVALVGSGVEGAQEFDWEFVRTDTNMSILVVEALLNDESLIEGDVVGAFTPAGLCGGFDVIPAGFPDQGLGLAVWGAEQGQNNGFAVGEEIFIRIWDTDAGVEYRAEYEVVNGVEPIFLVNGFMVITVSAGGEIEPRPDIVVEDLHDFGEVAIGEAAEWQMNVANAGDADLTIDAMVIDGNYFAVDFGEAVVVAPDEAAEFTVTFVPEEEGDFAATLTIQSNDDDVVVELSGRTPVQPEPPAIAVDPQALDFGPVLLGDDSSLDVTISNTGDELLVVDAIDLEEGVFTVDFNDPIEIDGGGSAEITVTFTPADVVDYAADMTIHSNDPDNDAVVVPLAGSGFEREQQPTIVVDPEALDFGRVAVDDESNLELMITNAGDELLVIDAINLEEGVFTIDFNDPIEIEGGAGFGLAVIFTPDAAGDFAADMTIHSNDPDNDAVVVPLAGTGFVPGEEPHFVFDVTDINMSMLITEALLIGETLVEGDEIGTFTNAGICAGGNIVPAGFPDDPMGVAAWGAEQGNDNGYAAGEDLNFRFWDFEAEEEFEAEIVEVVNEIEPLFAGNGFIVLRLAADGQVEPRPDIVVEDLHDFGEVEVGAAAEWQMNVANAGDADLVIDAMAIDGDYFAVDFADAVVVAPDEAVEFTVTFAPEEEGEFAATLTIQSNDGDVEVALSGRTPVEPNPPMISVVPEAIDFGDVEIGRNRVRDVTITNMGDEPLIVDAIDLEEGVFSVDFNDAIEIGGGDDLVIAVTFTPAEVADYGADMTIHSNDPDNDAVVVALAGSGVEAQEEFIWEFVRTEVNMSILVTEAILNDESLVEGDLVGAFTQDGLCAGFDVIPAGFPERNLGLAAWGAEQGQDNGFAVGEEINIRVWDIDADIDVAAEYEVINGVEPVFAANGFMVITISAQGEVEPRPDIVVEEAAHDFGEVEIGAAGEWQLNITNAGDADLVIDAMAIDGDYFAVDFADAVVVAPGEAVAYIVTFAPEEDGDFAATLTIQSNDGDVEVALRGHTPVVQEEPPMIVVDPDALDFGRVAVDRGRGRELIITNAGEELLVIDAIDLEEGVFTIDFNDPIEIAGGADFALVVTFTPDAVGDFAADMTIHSNDPENAEVVVPLAGTGFIPGEEPHFIFRITDTNMSVLVTEALLGGESLVPGDEVGVFTNGGLCAGGTIVPGNFPEAPMGMAAWGTEQGQNNGFAVGEDLNFRFWDFEAEIEVNAQITEVENNIEPIFAVNAFIVLRLGAEVEPEPDIVVGANAHNFGRVDVGGVAEWALNVSNVGDEDLVINAMDIDGQYFAVDFEAEVTFQPGEGGDFMVTFAPEANGFFEATLTITSNDPDEGVVEIALLGTTLQEDQPPVIVLSADELNFGQVFLGQERSLNLTISNDGDEFLVINAIDLGDDVFSTNFQNRLEVAGGGSEVLTVTFTPDARGLVETDMTIRSNDENNAAVVVQLSGFGFDPEEDRHFVFGITDVNMSLLITEATIDGRSLVESDEVGLFTNAGLCAGGDPVPANFPNAPMGTAAWGTEQGQNNGFAAGEDLNFRFWDHAADYEVEVQEIVPLGGVEPIFVGNGFMACLLHATGEPDVAVSNLAHDFRDVLVGTALNWNFTVTNTGFGELVVDPVEAAGEYFSVDFDEAVVLARDESQEFTVTFAPEEVGDFEGSVTITTNVEGNEEIVIDLIGSGTDDRDPEITLQRNRLNFGQVIIGNDRVMVLMGENTGNSVLDISELNIAGDGFSVDVDQLQVDPHQEFEIEVTFTPEDAQVYNGSLTIVSNDPDNDEVVVVLTGVGVEGGENEAPIVTNPIGDVNRNEDAGAFNIVDLDNVFADPDGDDLAFDVEGDANLRLAIDGNHILSMNPVANFFIDGTEVIVTADDGQNMAEFVMQIGRVADRSRSVRSIFNAPADPYRDDTVEDMFIIIINPMPDDPVWIEYPEGGVIVNAGEELVVFLEAADADQLFGGDDPLTIRWGDDDTLIERGAELTDNGDNTADLIWVPDIDDAGVYHPTFIVEDQTGRTGVIEVGITVFTSNPIIHAPTEDPEFIVDLLENEEIVLQFIADDMDNDPEELRWAVGDNDLPDGWEFDDHLDGDAEFAWTPTYDDAGAYFAVFVVNDPDGNTDEILVRFVVDNVARQVIILDPDGQGALGADVWAVDVNEGSLLQFAITALNPDGNDIMWDEDQLDADIAALPGNAVLNRNQPEVRAVTWTPPFDAARQAPYEILFIVTSELGPDFPDQLTVQITVLDHNPNPVIVSPIPDLAVLEDSGPRAIADLDTVFIDPEDPNNPINNYRIEGAPDEITLEIDNEHVLWLRALQLNYNNDAGADITIVARENGGNLEASDQFRLRVIPVNDAPGAFNLLSPVNGFAVNRGNYDLRFTWEAAGNVDGDEISYDLFLHAVYGDIDVTLSEEGIRLTNFRIVNLRDLLIENGIYVHQGDVRVDVTWWIVATDSDDQPLSTECNERWILDLQLPLTVPDPEDLIPTEFSLKPVYPNPFNPSVKVSFDLPRTADVKLTVWDLAGRKIADLAEGSMPAGRHTIEWNASGSPAGLYIFMLDTSEKRFLTKGALVR